MKATTGARRGNEKDGNAFTHRCTLPKKQGRGERPAILQFSSKALLQQIITSPRKFIGARAGAQAECAPRVIGFRSVQSPYPGAPVFPRALLLGKIRKLSFGNSHDAVCVPDSVLFERDEKMKLPAMPGSGSGRAHCNDEN